MGDLIPLSLVKSHLRIVHDDDDDYLSQLIAASLSHFQQFTGRQPLGAVPEYELAEDDIWMTTDITQGALLLIGHWYENRELVGEKNLSSLPATTYDLWSPYVLFHLGDPVE